jgi:hypothetical protein
MPRKTSQPRHKVFLPDDVWSKLHDVAVETDTTMAELVRRFMDLGIVFRLPPPNWNNTLRSSPIPFTLHIPAVMVSDFALAAEAKKLPPDVLLAQIADLYLARRAASLRVTSSNNASRIGSTDAPAP